MYVYSLKWYHLKYFVVIFSMKYTGKERFRTVFRFGLGTSAVFNGSEVI